MEDGLKSKYCLCLSLLIGYFKQYDPFRVLQLMPVQLRSIQQDRDQREREREQKRDQRQYEVNIFFTLAYLQ